MMENAQLTPRESKVILDQLPFQPNANLHADDTPIWESAKAKLTAAAKEDQ